MPLDTGSSPFELRLVDTTSRAAAPSARDHDSLGAYLKAVREHRGFTLVEVAKETRVRRAYLAAIEAGERATLPSRPFAIGYVRGYAQALGLDSDLAVARYKAEWPEAIERLQNPVGLAPSASRTRTVLYVLGGVLVVAVGLWNVAQRTLIRDEPRSLDVPVAVAAAPALTAPIKLAPMSEAPAESTIPAPYVTPGLEPAESGAAAPPPAPPPSRPFTPSGQVFGVAAGPATVVLQADHPVSLVLHGPDGTIYFARELAAGQAYRAPLGRGLIAALGDPSAVSVYLAGRLAPAITAEPVAIDKLEAAAATAAAVRR